MKQPENMTEAEMLSVGYIVKSTEAITRGEELAESGRELRNEHINKLRKGGWTIADVAMVSGMSQGAIQKIGDAAGLKIRPRKAPAKKAPAKRAPRAKRSANV